MAELPDLTRLSELPVLFELFKRCLFCTAGRKTLLLLVSLMSLLWNNLLLGTLLKSILLKSLLHQISKTSCLPEEIAWCVP